MDAKKVTRFLSVLVICILFAVLAVALVGQQFFSHGEKKKSGIRPLDNEVFQVTDNPGEVKCLALVNSEDEMSAYALPELKELLRQLKVNADIRDVAEDEIPGLAAYDKIILALSEFTKLGKTADELIDWVSGGGSALVLFPPKTDAVFQAMAPQMGIREVSWDMYELPGLRFLTDVMIGGKNKDFMISDPFDSSLTLSLYDDCTVHIVSADDRQVPVLWEKKHGEGKYVFDNFGIMEKAYRGIHAAAYSLLGEAFAWPVINGSAFYLDNFPSPMPSGTVESIERDYGITVKEFYTNIWWPDLLKLSEKYGCRYTGMLVEDYSGSIKAPFEENLNVQRFQYFGSSLLKSGGEIGIMGFNQIPLCREGSEAGSYGEYEHGTYEKKFNQKYWETKEDMAAGIQAALDFCGKLYPMEKPCVYAPPSNILSAEARRLLGEGFPQIRAVAGIFFRGDMEYVQDFGVAADGMIETPRIISGHTIDSFMEFAALSELNLHFVSSHFQSPDDALNVGGSADQGWEKMSGRLEEYMEWLYGSAPGLRSLTGSEMAGAVQRWYYLDVKQRVTEKEIILELDHFQDDAQLMIRINGREPDDPDSCITGGEMTPMGDGLYLVSAKDSHIVIQRGGK